MVRRPLSGVVSGTRITAAWLLLTLAVAIAYLLAARLSLALLTKPDGVAVFWPAAGIASGVLIRMESVARIPAIVGTIAGTIAANLLGDRNFWSAIVFSACNAGEAVLVAGLIARLFISPFRLESPAPCDRFVCSGDHRNRHIWDRRYCGLCFVPHFDGVGTISVVALVYVRRDRHHRGCAVLDRAAIAHRSDTKKRIYRRNFGSRDSSCPGCACYPFAEGPLGRRDCYRCCLPSVVVDCCPMQTVLCCSSHVHLRPYAGLDNDIW